MEGPAISQITLKIDLLEINLFLTNLPESLAWTTDKQIGLFKWQTRKVTPGLSSSVLMFLFIFMSRAITVDPKEYVQ